ncbi:MAG: RNA-directed DNA polymerase (Reverse transcriptase) [Deltaproteobacteria bacterium]|nr:RNA-directed DNA polymerase (Reverse transcriptase) [Deltaproteobacteria bacterium]
MKRVNHLFEKIVTFENLYLAFKKASKGSPNSLEAKAFCFHLEPELIDLKNDLISSSYQPGAFHHYTIHDPKERLISVAPFRDRVVHHALVNILEPVFEPAFIFDSYATRKNKGTHAAIKRTQQFLRLNRYYLRADIKKHFESMDHDILLNLVTRKVKDKKTLQLIRKIIKGVPWEKGLPIGNLTSQFLANVYLNQLDHYIKEQLKVRYYVRYMDDMVFLSNDKVFLKQIKQVISQYLENKLKLTLKTKATYINKRSNGIGFLGARIFPHFLRVKSASFKRGIKRLNQVSNQYKNRKILIVNYTSSLSSIMGHLDFFNSYQLRLKTGQANNWFEPRQTGRFLEQQTEEPALR